MSVLELGAAEESYLPDGLQLSRHVGVGADKQLMGENSALTESLVADLNDVIEEEEIITIRPKHDKNIMAVNIVF